VTPVKCIAKNDESGDCFRASLASILNIPASYVPHFHHMLKTDDHDEMANLVDAWLEPMGLAMSNMVMSANEPLEMVPIYVNNVNPGIPAILSGQTESGSGHSVVIQNGKVFNPSAAEITEPFGNGWWISFVSAADNFKLPRRTRFYLWFKSKLKG
jgi:hypothetical protein